MENIKKYFKCPALDVRAKVSAHIQNYEFEIVSGRANCPKIFVVKEVQSRSGHLRYF